MFDSAAGIVLLCIAFIMAAIIQFYYTDKGIHPIQHAIIFISLFLNFSLIIVQPLDVYSVLH